MLVVLAPGTKVAGVFTRSVTAAAPIALCRAHLEDGRARALIVNSGNANAFTGVVGQSHVVQTCEAVARSIDCDPKDVFVASTGVIGEILPINAVLLSIPELVERLSAHHWEAAARAIMTTDTFAKGACVESLIGKQKVTVSGFAKGSGMVEPDMATMLAFIFTDAAIPQVILQALLVEMNDASFHAITVDSDTSTSDTCLLFATGQAKNPLPVAVDDPCLKQFKQDLRALMIDLATQVIRDGEGATKLIKIVVSGADNQSAARKIAKTIANSPLVKTAMAGEDANWGRIVMAIGKSGQKVDPNKLEIRMGGHLIARGGQRVEDYDEKPVAEHLKNHSILIEVELGIGAGQSTVWSCDLTHGYIAINADYRS